MQRHVLDKPKQLDDAIRTREFVRLARVDGRHPSTRELHKRAERLRGSQRLQAFLRIERGETA